VNVTVYAHKKYLLPDFVAEEAYSKLYDRFESLGNAFSHKMILDIKNSHVIAAGSSRRIQLIWR
jgi:hypothetical protein